MLDAFLKSAEQSISKAPPIYQPPPPIIKGITLQSSFKRSLQHGHRDYALSAASFLLSENPKLFWRRLVSIAIRDFGLSDLNLTGQIVAAAANKRWREHVGGDLTVCSGLVARIVQEPCDRRLSYLYWISKNYSETGGCSERASECAPLDDVIDLCTQVIRKCERPEKSHFPPRIIPEACDGLLIHLSAWAQLPSESCAAFVQARRLVQNVLPVFLPIAFSATTPPRPSGEIIEHSLPQTREIGGMPSYAFDETSPIGRMALSILSEVNAPLRNILQQAWPDHHHKAVLQSALSWVEGRACRREANDKLYCQMKAVTARSRTSANPSALGEILVAVREAIPEINDIREELYESNRG